MRESDAIGLERAIDRALDTTPEGRAYLAKRKETEAEVERLRDVLHDMDRKVESLLAENHRLREELSEWDEAVIFSQDERCTANEKHCSCVPILHREIERLRAALEHIRDWQPDRSSHNQRSIARAALAGFKLVDLDAEDKTKAAHPEP